MGSNGKSRRFHDIRDSPWEPSLDPVGPPCISRETLWDPMGVLSLALLMGCHGKVRRTLFIVNPTGIHGATHMTSHESPW